MPGPSRQSASVRAPAFAGTFYPADPERCREMARRLVEPAAPIGDAESGPGDSTNADTKPVIGGIVPHAGWICSGAIAGQTIAAIAGGALADSPDLIVVFAAIHR